GQMPTRDYSLFYVGDSGNVLKFQADEGYSDGIEFTAMSYSFTPTYNPANTPRNFVQQSSSSIPVHFSYQTTATTDPGPLVTLAPIVPLTPTISATADSIFINWLTRPNQHYQLEATTNLLDPGTWAALGNLVIGNGEPHSQTDTIGEHPSKFYRVHILPQSSPPTP
ncbi:MAG: hypothetical protein NTW21_32800, partial [Verrucomicrobia bacterium]|nr:hypothetical protein [Verrucomicrobiota bacterium]